MFPDLRAALLMAAVTVVGAGVSGLTTALRLAEAGHDVTVVVPRPSGGHHLGGGRRAVVPYRVLPYDRVLAWSATATAFARLAAARVGVRLRWGTELLRREPGDEWWAPAVPALASPHVPPATRRDGGSVAVVDMGRYLPWLAAEAGPRGHAGAQAVGCRDLAGLAARGRLRRPRRGPGPRSHRHPVRGQVVVTDPVGWRSGCRRPRRPAHLR